ncbi:hypothetical protein GCM10027446_26290 [Angustibacter peucedani]
MRLDHVGIVLATDEQVEEVARFFSTVLGLPVSGEPSGGYAEVHAGGSTIALHRGLMRDDLLAPHGGTLLQLACDDATAAVDQVRARGGDVVLEPTVTDWGSTTAYVRGPHGVLVELSS